MRKSKLVALIVLFVSLVGCSPAEPNTDPTVMWWAEIPEGATDPVVHEVWVNEGTTPWKVWVIDAGSPSGLPGGANYVPQEPASIWESDRSALFGLMSMLRDEYDVVLIQEQELEDDMTSVQAAIRGLD